MEHDSQTTSVDKKRARKKFMSEVFGMKLAEANPHSPILKRYLRQLHCMDALTPNGEGRLTAHYCKQRSCPVCNSIRTAILINGYGPQLRKLTEPQFVTLTRPTVTAQELPAQIERMAYVWRIMKQRSSMRKVRGLRKAECTIRPDGMYHYHFHLIVDGRENAERMMMLWLELNPESVRAAQNMKPADNGSMIELFKYFTKLLGKDRSGQRHVMDYSGLDVIFRALSGKRIFQPFGGLSMVSEEIEDEDLKATREIAEQIYQWIESDWYGTEYGDALTDYEPSQSLMHLLELPNSLKTQ